MFLATLFGVSCRDNFWDRFRGSYAKPFLLKSRLRACYAAQGIPREATRGCFYCAGSYAVPTHNTSPTREAKQGYADWEVVYTKCFHNNFKKNCSLGQPCMLLDLWSYVVILSSSLPAVILHESPTYCHCLHYAVAKWPQTVWQPLYQFVQGCWVLGACRRRDVGGADGTFESRCQKRQQSMRPGLCRQLRLSGGKQDQRWCGEKWLWAHQEGGSVKVWRPKCQNRAADL